MGPYDCISCGPDNVCNCEKVTVRVFHADSGPDPLDVFLSDARVDMVNHPPHYQKSWGEVIDITETMNFNMGNAVKYILRADDKGSFEQDIRKAIWYLERELKRRG